MRSYSKKLAKERSVKRQKEKKKGEVDSIEKRSEKLTLLTKY